MHIPAENQPDYASLLFIDYQLPFAIQSLQTISIWWIAMHEHIPTLDASPSSPPHPFLYLRPLVLGYRSSNLLHQPTFIRILIVAQDVVDCHASLLQFVLDHELITELPAQSV